MRDTVARGASRACYGGNRTQSGGGGGAISAIADHPRIRRSIPGRFHPVIEKDDRAFDPAARKFLELGDIGHHQDRCLDTVCVRSEASAECGGDEAVRERRSDFHPGFTAFPMRNLDIFRADVFETELFEFQQCPGYCRLVAL